MKINGKTPSMRLLELQHQQPIEILLLSGSLRQVAEKLGIDHSTVSRWIKRLCLEVVSKGVRHENTGHR